MGRKSEDDELRRAAEGGDLAAINRLAGGYFERNQQAPGLFWLEKAAELGDTTAMNSVAAFILERDTPRAERYLRQAAAAGEVLAMHNLGHLLCRHSDARAAGSVAEGMTWYLKAAQRGYPAAMHNLAVMLQDDRPHEAIRWFGFAAEEGLPDAMEELAELLQSSRPAEAKLWSDRAAQARRSYRPPKNLVRQ